MGSMARLARCTPPSWMDWMVFGLGVLLLGTACTARAPIAIPADLPNRTDQGEFHFRWALVRDPVTVHAVGWIESPSRIVSWATLALFGVDRDGGVVSRGETEVQGGFGQSTLPFVVALRPTGREERFELVLIHAPDGKPGD